jgi:hypothetical protein
MFSRASCYFFVRPKKKFLEVCVFLGRPVKAPQIRRVEPSSKTKLVHFIQIQHRDQVEAPITDWLQEAYEFSGAPVPKPAPKARKSPPKAIPAKKPKAAKTIAVAPKPRKASTSAKRKTKRKA